MTIGSVRDLLQRGISWIHPSYRDLVIEELTLDESLRNEFLRLTNLEGIKLAVSQAGGSKGERRMPLLCSDRSWDMLATRCTELLTTVPIEDTVVLIRVLRSATVDLEKKDRERLIGVLQTCCDTARKRWDEAKATLKQNQLREFYEATMLMDPLPALPKLGPTWKSAESAFARTVRAAGRDSELLDADDVLEWAKLTMLLKDNEPRFLRQIGFPDSFIGVVAELVKSIEGESDLAPPSDDPEDLFAEADRMETLTAALAVMADLFPDQSQQILSASEKAGSQEDHLRELSREAESDGKEYDTESRIPSDDSAGFDWESIFSDL